SGSSTSRRASSATNSATALLDSLRLEELRHRLRRQRALLEPAAHLLFVEVDERRLRLRVVAADDLDELAVARRARIGGDDAVDRVLLRADPRQSQFHCHLATFSLSSCVWTSTCVLRSGAAGPASGGRSRPRADQRPRTGASCPIRPPSSASPSACAPRSAGWPVPAGCPS